MGPVANFPEHIDYVKKARPEYGKRCWSGPKVVKLDSLGFSIRINTVGRAATKNLPRISRIHADSDCSPRSGGRNYCTQHITRGLGNVLVPPHICPLCHSEAVLWPKNPYALSWTTLVKVRDTFPGILLQTKPCNVHILAFPLRAFDRFQNTHVLMTS